MNSSYLSSSFFLIYPLLVFSSFVRNRPLPLRPCTSNACTTERFYLLSSFHHRLAVLLALANKLSLKDSFTKQLCEIAYNVHVHRPLFSASISYFHQLYYSFFFSIYDPEFFFFSITCNRFYGLVGNRSFTCVRLNQSENNPRQMKVEWNADTKQTFCIRKHALKGLGYLVLFKL